MEEQEEVPSRGEKVGLIVVGEGRPYWRRGVS